MPGNSGSRQALKEGVLWVVGLAGVFALVYFSDHLLAAYEAGKQQARAFVGMTTEPVPPQVVENGFERSIRLRADAGGHFAVRGWINGRPLALMADTGASMVALTYEDAERVGLNPRLLDYSGQVRTANGIAQVAPVTLDSLRIEDIEIKNVRAAVAGRGAMEVSLLGMSFLSKLRRIEVSGQELILVQ